MWGFALIFIVVVSCNAEQSEVKTAELPMTSDMSDNHIIGGSHTTIDKYPFVVQVLFKNKFICGGSLVTRRHVLSAARCFVDKKGKLKPVKDLSIREGTTMLNSGGSVHLVKEIIVHKLYNYMDNDNDVAMVVMATRVDSNTSVARRTLIAKKDAVVPENSFVTVVGWGRTNEAIPAATNVLEVTVWKINLDTCRARYVKLQAQTGKPYPVTNSTICCAEIFEKRSLCMVASGGPLVSKGILVGIISWGIGCAHPDYPAICARVAKFTDWIVDTAKNTTDNSGSLSRKVGAITLLTPLLYLILSV